MNPKAFRVSKRFKGVKPIGAEGINAQTLGTSGLGIKAFKPYKAFKGLRSGDLNLGLGIPTGLSLKPYRDPLVLGV